MRVARVFRPVVAALLFALSGVAPAGAVPAQVSGAEALNIRRGPGTQHSAFAQLVRDEQVEVTKIVGDWAAVRTQGGAEGWVVRQYLTVLGQPPRVEAPPVTPVRTPASAGGDELQQLKDEVAQLAAERDALRDQLAQATPAPVAADVPRGDGSRMQSDVQQLLQLTQELRQMVASQRERSGDAPASMPASASAENDSWLLRNGWVLTMSLIVGVLGGMVYGRAQERRRRNRIRF